MCFMVINIHRVGTKKHILTKYTGSRRINGTEAFMTKSFGEGIIARVFD